MIKGFLSFCILTIFILSCNSSPTRQEPVAYHNEVVEPYTLAIRENPKDPHLYFLRANALAQVNADSLALIDLQKAVQLDSLQGNYFQALGLAYLKNKQAKNAIIAFQKNLDLSPGEVRVRLLLSKAYLENQQIEAAQMEVNKVLAAAPDYPDALFWQAQIFAAQKDTTAALGLLQKAIAADPEYYMASMTLANYLAAQKKPESIAYYRKTFQLDTLDLAPIFEIGIFYLSLGDVEMAKDAFKECILSDNNYTPAYLEMGKILLEQDSVDKALRQFQLGTRTAPDNAEAYYYKGLSFEKLNQKDSARSAYQQALVFKPGDQKSKQRLEKVK